MVNIKLSYFNIQGPAEPVRLALVLAGIAFEDNRLDRDGMVAMRDAGALTPKGCAGHQVPLLEVDGKPLLQSNAQAQYCAKLAGIYPSDPWLAAKCDECTQFIQQDIRERLIAPSMRAPDEDTKVALRKELHETKLPEKFAMLDAMLAETGYLVGGELSIADIHLYVLCNWIGMGTLDGIGKEVITQFAHVAALVKKLNEHEKIKAWNAKNNPKLPWL